jgi:predicted dehydrogenase
MWPIRKHADAYWHNSKQTMDYLHADAFQTATAINLTLVDACVNPKAEVINEFPRLAVELMEAEKAKPTVEEMVHFIDCIENGKTPETTPEDSLEGLRVIWKLYEAEDAMQIADLRGIGFEDKK